MACGAGASKTSLPRLEHLESRLLLDVSGVWAELGYRAASGGGISYDTTESTSPQMVVSPNGYPLVMWQNLSDQTLRFARYDGMSWIPLGPAGTSNLSIGATGHLPQLAIDSHTGTPYVAWVTGATETAATEIYLRYWDGTQWRELGGSASGGGISNDGVISEEVSLAVGLDGLPVVAYRGYDESANAFQIIAKKWTGTLWQELVPLGGQPFPKTVGGQATIYGHGLSNDVFNSFSPSLTIGPDNAPVVAWVSQAFGQASEIYLRRWDGTDWVMLGGSATAPGAPPGGGVSNDGGQSLRPQVLVGPDPGGSVNPLVVVAWMDYPDALRLVESALYVRRYDAATDTWVAYSAGSDSGDGLLGLRQTVPEYRMAMGADGTLLLTYEKNFPNATDPYCGFVMVSEMVGGVPVWVNLPDNTPGVDEVINSAVQNVRFPWLVKTPDGTIIIAYSNLLSGVISDSPLRASPYDPFHLPNGLTTGEAPIDSEIFVQYWDGTGWLAYGRGASDLGGIEASMGQSGIEYNSPPQLAADHTGATVMAYLTRVSDPNDRYAGHLEPRIVRYNEGTGQWEDLPVPDLGYIDAPLSAASSTWPYVNWDGLSWYGDMLLIAGDPQVGGQVNGQLVLAYVNAENGEDLDAAVTGRATIRVFLYDDNGTPNNTSDDYWRELKAGDAGTSKYAYVAGGTFANGYQVDQVTLTKWTNGRVALFWRGTNPVGDVTGLVGYRYVGNNFTQDPAKHNGTSDVFGSLWDPNTSTWGIFPGSAGLNLTLGFGTYAGLNFDPSVTVTPTGALVLSFAAGQLIQAPSDPGSSLLLPFIQNSVEMWTYDDTKGWLSLRSLAPTGAGAISYWGPSVGVGLSGGPLVAWTAENMTAMAFDAATNSLVKLSSLLSIPTTDQGTLNFFVTGFWAVATSDIYASQWPTGLSGGNTVPLNLSNTGHAMMPAVFGNGSQFPVVSWTDAAYLHGAGYPFFMLLTLTPNYDGNENFVDYSASSNASIPVGPQIGVSTVRTRPYSSFDDREFYSNHMETSQIKLGTAAAALYDYAHTATTPGTERIYARRWNPNLGVWEQFVTVDTGGSPIGYSAQGNGISGQWGPGFLSSVAIRTVGQGTDLYSQPVVAWMSLYDGSIYGRGWMQEGQIPHLVVQETSGAYANDDLLEFGNLYLTQVGRQRFTLANTGAAALKIGSILTDLGTDFQITDIAGNPVTFPLTIPRNGSKVLIVKANPGDLGPFEHYVTIYSSDPRQGEYTLTLRGLRYSHAQIQVEERVGVDNDLVIPFGTVATGDTATRTFLIRNVGTDPLHISQMIIGGPTRSFVPWVIAAQNSTGQSSFLPVLGGVGPSECVAQSFQLTGESVLHKVQLYLSAEGLPADNVYVQIETDAGGSPSGVPITGGVSSLLSAADVAAGSFDWYGFLFSQEPRLQAGTVYWIVLYRDGGQDIGNYVAWGLGEAGAYSGGQAADRSLGTWETGALADADALFVVGTVMDASTLAPAGTLTVYVDFTGTDAASQGVMATGVFRHDDYEPRGLPATSAANPVRLTFTANKTDFQKGYTIFAGGADPSVGLRAITWTGPTGVQLQVLNYPAPSSNPVITISGPTGAHSRTDGNYVVWEENDSIWLYNIVTRTATDLGALWAGREYAPSIDNGRIAFATDANGDWDIAIYDIASGTLTVLRNAGVADFYPDLSGGLLAWRTTPIRASGNPWDASEIANTDKNVYALDLTTLSGGTFSPLLVSVGAAPGARVPAVSDGQIVWSEQLPALGVAYQLHYFDMVVAAGGTIVDQVSPISDTPSIDGDLVTWASNMQGNWDLYGYYFPLRAGETSESLEPRGRIFQLTYSTPDQQAPALWKRLLAYQEWDAASGSWTIKSATLGLGGNTAPYLTIVMTLTGASEDTDFVIDYATLLAATDAADIEGDTLSFVILSVTSGTLTKGGVPVVPGVDTLGPGETIVWRADGDANGLLGAFTVEVTDGALVSAAPVPVQVQVAPVNDAPVLPDSCTLLGARESTPFTIDHATLLAASGATDVDGPAPIRFRVDSVLSGTLRVNGVAAVPGTTMIGPADTAVWQGAAGDYGLVPAFAVSASDGTLFSLVSQTVNVDVAPDVPPDLPATATLGGAVEDTLFTFSYTTLLAASGVTDVDGPTPIRFRLDSILSGTLRVNGATPVVGGTLIGPGATMTWQGASHASGLVPAFTISATDGIRFSDASQTVSVDVLGINAAPRVGNQVLTANEFTPLTITLAAADEETAYADLVFNVPARSAHGTLTWIAPGKYSYLADVDFNGIDSFTYTVTDTGDPAGTPTNVLSSGTGTIQITVGTRLSFDAKNPAKFVDADGDLVTVSMTGTGAGSIRFPAAGQSDMSGIALIGSPTATLTVTITPARAGKLATTTVHYIESTGGLTKITAAGLDLIGVAGGGHVTVAAPDTGAVPALTVVLGRLTDVSFTSAGSLSLTAWQWDSEDAAVETLTAPLLTTLAIKGNAARGLAGDFAPNLVLTRAAAVAASTNTLGTATIAGGLLSALWDITGPVGGITAGNVTDWQLGTPARTLTKVVTGITLGQVQAASLYVDQKITTLKALNWGTGTITAGSIGTLSIPGKPGASSTVPPIIRGDFGADLVLDRSGLTGTTPTLGATTIAGDLRASSWEIAGDMAALKVGFTLGQASDTNTAMFRLHTTGSIAGITAGAIRHADVLAGVTTADPTSRRATAAGEFTNTAAAIKSVVVTGWKASVAPVPTYLFEDSNFSAAKITTATILNTDWANLDDPLDPLSGTVFGFFARTPAASIGTIISKDTVLPTDATRNWTWKPTMPLGTRGPAGSKFQINVV